MRINFKRAGFTLAEVLITLGIIGVVAAMTIPNLMTKIQWLQLHASFKHAYSSLSNGLQLTLNNEETSEACYYSYNSSVSGLVTNLTSCNQFFKNFEKNLKVMQVCNGNALNNGCILKYKGQEEVQNIVDNEEKLENFNKNCGYWSTNAINNVNRVVVLIDGTVIVYYGKVSMPLFMVDTNGRKGPNKWGYDIFVFSVKEAQSGAVYLAATNSCMVVEAGGKTTQQMLTRNK